MSTVAPDRRILKAFYTQYVAVLLIVLVFVIAGFQGPAQYAQPPAVRRAQLQDALIGALPIRIPQDAREKLSAHQLSGLDAIAEFVRNHDVRATFHLPIRADSNVDYVELLQQSLMRADELRGHMVGLGVPSSALRTVLFHASDPARSATVTFSSMEEEHEQR